LSYDKSEREKETAIMKIVTKWKWNSASMFSLTLAAFSLMLAAGVAADSGPTFTTIDVPGATFTNAWDISSDGDIVGVFRDAANNAHGFLLSNGNFSTIDFPGATQTRAFGINPRGDIVGDYRDAGNNYHGYLLRDGVLSSIDFPGGTFTQAFGISPNGSISGNYDANGKTHAFILDKLGEFVTLDPPFSFEIAMAHGINSNGIAVGCWWDADGMMHSLMISDGEYITNDFPNCKMSMNYKVNAQGWVVGYYLDAGGATHGYQAKGIRNHSAIDFPGATYTEAHGINDSKEIVGMYKDASNKTHGFLLSTN
jgi:probable HAF family extracellular repeat protein